MSASILLSVVVLNYNYARFLPIAIDSVLDQGASDVELIVVDDCSTDHSRDVIAAYGSSIIPVLHPQNRGHGAGFNSGWERASGKVVMFLDADDFLLPGALKTIVENIDESSAMYLYRMLLADEEGRLGDLYPPEQIPLANGDISAELREKGRYSGTVTSGLVFSRAALSKIMPMDPEIFRMGGDGYLSAVAPLYGQVRALDVTVSGYRKHSSNHSGFSGYDERLVKRARWCLGHDAARYAAIESHAKRLNLPVADNLGGKDRLHIEQRMISILMDTEDRSAGSRVTWARYGQRTLDAGASSGKRIFNYFWWTILERAPEGLARTILMWKVDSSSRPKSIDSAARWVRKRLGIVL